MRSRLRSYPPKRRKGGHRDPVTPQTFEAVWSRDRGCVGPRIGMAGPCWGPVELDHIRVGGMGLRSPSTLDNLVSLCSIHHRAKTEAGRVWRPVLLEWVRSRENPPTET